MRIESERLILRDLNSGDIPELVNIWTDRETTRFIGGQKCAHSLKNGFAKDVKTNHTETYNLKPVILKKTSGVVGHCGIFQSKIGNKSEIELMYVFKKSEWGNGYASEILSNFIDYAFDSLKVNRLIAQIKSENKGSIKLAGKLGFKYWKDTVEHGNSRSRVFILNSTTP